MEDNLKKPAGLFQNLVNTQRQPVLYHRRRESAGSREAEFRAGRLLGSSAGGHRLGAGGRWGEGARGEERPDPRTHPRGRDRAATSCSNRAHGFGHDTSPHNTTITGGANELRLQRLEEETPCSIPHTNKAGPMEVGGGNPTRWWIGTQTFDGRAVFAGRISARRKPQP